MVEFPSRGATSAAAAHIAALPVLLPVRAHSGLQHLRPFIHLHRHQRLRKTKSAIWSQVLTTACQPAWT